MEQQQQVDTAAIQATATSAERTRIAAILALPEAKGREALAQQLALTPGIDADSGKALLAAAPKPNANPLAAAMPPNPGVQPGAEGTEDNIDAEVQTSLRLAGIVKGDK